MLLLCLFLEQNVQQEVNNTAYKVMSKLEGFILSYHIDSCEKYWKINGWYKVTVSCQLPNPVTHEEAIKMLEGMCNIWIWDAAQSSAHTNDKHPEVKFVQPELRFITCWFENLE